MQSNIEDFVKNIFMNTPKKVSFQQLRQALIKSDTYFQTMSDRQSQRNKILLQNGAQRMGVWEHPDDPDDEAPQ